MLETEEELLLRPHTPFPPTQIEEVSGFLKYSGPAIPVERLGVDRSRTAILTIRKMMTGLDTNTVLRLIARDDRTQLELARRLVTSTTCFLPNTVLLEVAWVLRSTYGAARQQMHSELMAVLGLPCTSPEGRRFGVSLPWNAA